MNYRKTGLAYLICLFVCFPSQYVFSDDIAKADKYYEKFDYKYAINIYEKIMLEKPSLEVAQKLANCYRFINNSELTETAFAKVITFSGFDPITYKYYADALKQNSKFQEAKENYLLYAERVPAQAEEAKKMADACDVANTWANSPDTSIQIQSESQLNSGYSEFAPVKYNDGYVFVSDRFDTNSPKSKQIYGWTGNSYLKIYQTDSIRSVSTLSLLPKPINNEYHNGPAVFTQDNKEIYFTRTQVIKNKRNKYIQIGKKYLYHSIKNGDSWAEPTMLSLGLDANVQHPALSPDGKILYFASNMSGGYGGMDIYATIKQEDGNWGNPVNCGESINTPEDEVFPSVRNDGQFYFSSKGHVGMGGLDVFTAKGSYTNFSNVENLKAPMNSTKDDFGILFFNNLSGLISSNRNGGMGLDDIYRFKSTPVTIAVKPPVQLLLAIDGNILDQNGVPLKNVEINLINKATGVKKAFVSDALGKFYFQVDRETDYVLQSDTKKQFSNPEIDISTKNLKEATVFNVKFELKKPEEENLFSLNNIYYNFNKWNLRSEALPELNKLVKVIKTKPEIIVQIRSHTDVRGTSAYNLWLSQKRAQAVINYLKKKGVSAKRLKALGFGEMEVINRCQDGVKCSDAEHQMNRRTEFKISIAD